VQTEYFVAGLTYLDLVQNPLFPLILRDVIAKASFLLLQNTVTAMPITPLLQVSKSGSHGCLEELLG
jgi:hypothetical protein